MKLTQLFQKAAELENKTVAVAHAEDDEVLQAVKLAVDKQFARFLLIGHREKIRHMMKELDIPKRHVDIIHSETPEASAKIAVQSVKSGNADVLMKGHVPTAVLLKAVLNKEYGLRSSHVLSHVAAFEVEGFDRLICVTDAAMNIHPKLEELKQILENAVRVARAVGVQMPKVACLAAVETVNPAMEATLNAAALTQMNHRGQIKDCIVDGPLALDNAISELAARHKNISGIVAGQADILLVPSIETGNVLYKSLIHFAGAKVGAILAGAKAPIALTSRADSAENKLYSIALALCTSEARQEEE
ncbi:phosphate butyryltransferase [Bacillus glycinifermentans]|uniref:Phosphate butyryltransferase n=1 Tax=Bacillus glycinifermentans TaxID=1664069 RepID=A0A0J6ECJ7_9BACI|nr:phosphate butyryltransferase [Bacillus glycinifermentans]ATH92321.1 phosphate butyryltransferase [Bacillus glycinifermentans]KMM54379.1 phosphate butyryltransferase [Bacillus glycinifermentans]KRT95068.1 phosphate butyryltransferase [Bacillus glycinifermentans]MEC0484845.1 phosphate butyryltransferase [Bacillus glycinifermentans]MEC0495962.1 phosphate butyryltransferase [Bacillus glycinifermentans]